LNPSTPSTTVQTEKYRICHATLASCAVEGNSAAPIASAITFAMTSPTAPGMQVITVKRSGDQPGKRLAESV
jgi:hypothetical protein